MQRVIPHKAIAYIASKKLKTSFNWYEVYAEEHQHAFTVAKVMETDLLSDIHKAVEKAIRNGETLRDFKKGLLAQLGESGWGNFSQVDEKTGDVITRLSDRRLKKIYEVNKRQANQYGNWQRFEASKKHFPYLQYRIGASVVHREAHLRFNGLVLHIDDPFWDTHMPMNGWGCKCWVQQLTEKKAQEIGISQSLKIEYHDWVNPHTGEVKKVPKGISPGFEYNVGKHRSQAIENIVGDKISEKKNFAPHQALRLLGLLSKGKVNDVQSLHFKKGYEVLEQIVKDNPNKKLRELQNEFKQGLFWKVAFVSNELQQMFKAKTNQVWISDQTLIKQIVNRNGQPIFMKEYFLIDEIINKADEKVFFDDKKVAFFHYKDHWYKVVVKTTVKRDELIVLSFYKTTANEIKRDKRKVTR